MRERCEKEDLGLTEKEYREAAQDICSKPSDYLFIWVKDHLKEFHRVDALRKDLQEKLKAAEYCLNEVYDVLRMTYTEESETPLLVKQTLQKISEVES